MPKEYEVGYKKPPKQHQWPKGVSGNPGGREKGHKGLKTDLEAALNAITETENRLTGKRVKGRNQKLAIDRLAERAALGDLKAQALLFPMILQVLGIGDRHQGPRKLSAIDQQILAEVLGERIAEAIDMPPLLTDAGGAGDRIPPGDVTQDADEPDGDGEDLDGD